MLTLPSVQVGPDQYNAQLLLQAMPNTPLGWGFLLQNAVKRSANDAAAATSTYAAEIVTMPEVDLLNNPSGQGKVKAQMKLIPGSNPLLFELTQLEFL